MGVENYLEKLGYTQKEFGNLKVGDYLSLKLHSNIGETNYKDNKKYRVTLETDHIELCGAYLQFIDVPKDTHKESIWEPSLSEYFKIEWCLMKDDVSPQDIFQKHQRGGPDGRADVAKYCIQDCELCINLTIALDVIPNNIAMANVCYVPQSYIYLRDKVLKSFLSFQNRVMIEGIVFKL